MEPFVSLSLLVKPRTVTQGCVLLQMDRNSKLYTKTTNWFR